MSGTKKRGSAVSAIYSDGLVTVTPASTDWECVTWTDDQGAERIVLNVGQHVLMQLRAYASVAACNLRVLHRPREGYPWVELVASTEVAVAAPAALDGASGEVADDEEVDDGDPIYDDQIHTNQLLVQVAQATTGGSLTLALACK